MRRHLHALAARPFALVSQELPEASPSNIGDVECETVISNHVLDVQVFDHDNSVALAVSRRDRVQRVIALAPYLAVQLRDSDLCFLSVLRSFLASADDARGVSEAFQSLLQVVRVLDAPAVGIGDKNGDAAVERDDWFGARRGCVTLDLAGDADEPLVDIANECGSFCLSTERPMQDNRHRTELRKTQRLCVERPCLRMVLAEAERIASMMLPPWSSSELFEARLPSLVEFDQELRRDVARDVCKPWQLGPQLRQLVDLIEGRAVSLHTRAQIVDSLFVGEIPQPSQRALPCCEPSDLLSARIDAVAEHFVNDHGLTVRQSMPRRKQLS